MAFWIFALGLAGLAALSLVLAFRRGAGAASEPAASDLGVYRDQLREVERDLARGILAPDEAGRVRLEVSRRLLEADRALTAAAAPAEASRGLTGAAAAMTAVVVIGGAAFVYDRLGAPGFPDQPIAARIALAEELRQSRPTQAAREAALPAPAPNPDTDPQYLQMVARLRTVVAERPDDRQGLELLARTEAGLGNHAAAHAAQARLIAAKGAEANADDYAALGQMLIMAGAGYVSPEAEAALGAALARDPGQPVARYFQGLLLAQIGRPDQAFPLWQALLAEGPPDAPWVVLIRGQIEDLAYLAGRNDFVLPPEATGPGAEDMAAASSMSPEERGRMIRGMVEGLAQRLATDGGPASDWARLIRAYGVLGEAQTAAPVLEEARAAFAGDPAGLAEIEAAARDAGLVP